MSFHLIFERPDGVIKKSIVEIKEKYLTELGEYNKRFGKTREQLKEIDEVDSSLSILKAVNPRSNMSRHY